MKDLLQDRNFTLSGLSPAEWQRQLARLGERMGAYEQLGRAHLSVFVDQSRTLLVSFESAPDIRARGGEPLALPLAREMGVSVLSLISAHDTWFRAPEVYGYFDRLIDDGFFEDFDRVVFTGRGAGGYAAAAFSVAAPGATVISLAPQATLDPARTPWEHRFRKMRRVSFRDRYGYAPEMAEAAEQVYVLFDPFEATDAMHASLFHASNTTLQPLPRLGKAPHRVLSATGALHKIRRAALSGTLTPARLAGYCRARFDHVPYLETVMHQLDRAQRPYLTLLWCRAATRRTGAASLKRRLHQLQSAADQGLFKAPPAA